MMSNLKLGVEVTSAHDLLPKEQGTSNPFVEIEFDDQKFRTAIKDRDINPVWNEQFYFNISDPSRLQEKDLEAYVYHVNRTSNSKTCLGKVRISGTSFVSQSDATPLHYPLEKRTIISRARGELGLRVFLTDDPSVRVSAPGQEFDFISTPTTAQEQAATNVIPNPFQETRADQVRQFQHLPKEQHRPQPMTAQPYYPESSYAQQQQQQQQQKSYSAVGNKAEGPPPPVMRMFAQGSQQPVDFQLKETSPTLGGGRVIGGRVIPGEKAGGAYDLVEKMQYLFVRVVKARDLPNMDITGSLDPYVEVHLGNYKMKTRYFEKNQRPEWDEVFAFPREVMQSTSLEVVVKDKDILRDDYVGRVMIDLNEVPVRVPPDSPLAPEWYRLVGKDGHRDRGELMLAVWYGTQADECFPSSIHAGSTPVDSHLHNYIRGKVYPVPRMWYVRVHVIEAQDIIPMENHIPDVFVKVRLGHQMLKTRPARSPTRNFMWNEEMIFVAAEPFEEDLIISIEDRVAPNKDQAIGELLLPLARLPRRADHKPIRPAWFDLRRPGLIDLNQLKEDKFYAKVHLRICLEGGYHVLDESTQYCSDLRPTMKQLWKPPIGLLEVGILSANGLIPTKTRHERGSCDAYCVAKYGQKWVRTRTIVDNLNPRFNEQYTWDVFDHGTVLTIGLFDNCIHMDSNHSSSHGNMDKPIGKVRIRLSTLETGRVYTHTYPLLVLHPSGVKKMGELHLAIRFSATSLLNVFFTYSRPLLPKMHYAQPLSIVQQEMLRHQAVQLVAQRLGRMEPPVRREVVEYMSDARSHLWSMRRSKANFFRLMQVFSGLIAAGKWFGDVCQWKNPVTTVLVHVLFIMLVFYPDLILPTIFLYMFLIGLWNYRFRPRFPPHMNTRISHADMTNPDELDEEFDTFPTSKSPDLVRMRYDRLRHVAGRIQTVVGDIATQGERLQSLLSWRDPRATSMFLLFCLLTAVILYVTPFPVIALCLVFFFMRHPRFRHKVPSAPVNFFRRLPAKTDSLL
ncbi:FT-interacting protein 3-like [Oryza brachyantha]|uniref:C2 domain-containing protein n=1 Tax=Oryza brachyantha TaxID=4533 RepID=J3MKW4_ORYBR|nr:FT-interacting protein 3-like [Oryza brachyantha]